jgi:hypothetical protein
VPLEIRTAKEARELLGWAIRDDDPRFSAQPVTVFKTRSLGPTRLLTEGVQAVANEIAVTEMVATSARRTRFAASSLAWLLARTVAP